MYKITKSMNCRTVKGTNLTVKSGTLMESYTVNYDRNSVTLIFPDMSCEIENDFDIAEYIEPIPHQKKYIHEQENTKNWNRREEVAVILKYLKSTKAEYGDKLDSTIISFLTDEIKIFENEYNKLSILTSTDSEIIQSALVDYAEKLEPLGNEVATKMNDVRSRYLKMVNAEK